MPLIQARFIDEVLGQLPSGKEAEVFVVRSEGEVRCAKVYKEANNRTFRQKSQYTEGRKVRNSRRSRAMESSSRYGRQEKELEWHNTEVEALSLLAAAGARVPKTFAYYEGVLVLELVTDEDGSPAPRLSDLKFNAEDAKKYHDILMREAVVMLCAGFVHGDFSEFNVLLAKGDLVVIDFPQAVQATANNAFSIFERDLVQLRAFFGKFAPELLKTNYAKEIWKIYQNGKLRKDSRITGHFVDHSKKADIRAVLEEIDDARMDAMHKRGNNDS